MAKTKIELVTFLVSILIVLPLLGACTSKGAREAPIEATVEKKGTTDVPTEKTVSKGAPMKPQRGGTLVYAMSGDPSELDPNKLSSAITRNYVRFMYNTLLTVDKDGNIIPELAESWFNPDPNTYVFKLRMGVKFHDGTDFNAQAVKFNIERILDPATKAFLGRPRLLNVKSVEVTDDYTVKFNLKTPQAALPGYLTLEHVAAIISPAAVKKWGDESVIHPVGTGPFEFVEWVKGDHLTVKRFDGYWRKDEYGDPLPYLDRVVIKPISDSSVMLTNLRTADVDVISSLLPAQKSLVERDDNLRIVQYGSSRYFITLNLGKPPFDNKALRQAVAWAIDREVIIKSIYGGAGAAAQYLLDSRNWSFDTRGKSYTYDLAKAKEKLIEGGKPNGFKFTAKIANNSIELQVAQALKDQLAKVGIEMEIVPLETRLVTLARDRGDYEAAPLAGGALPPDPDVDLFQFFHSTGSNASKSKYKNPEVDKLLERAGASYDQAERKTLYAKVQALALDDSPYIYLRLGPEMLALNQKVNGFIPSADIYHLPFDWLWLKR